MALPKLQQYQVLAAKVETTPYTAIALTNADAGFRVIDRHFRHIGETEMRERQAGLGVDSNIGGVTAHSEVTFTTHVAGKGASGVPAWGIFLQACGFSLATQTYTASSDTSTWKQLSMGAFIDGRRMLGRGFMGNGVLTLESGKVPRIGWRFLGGYTQDPDDSAILTGMTYDAAVPKIWEGTGSLTLGGGTTYTNVQKIEIDFGCDVGLRENPNQLGGYDGGFLGQRITRVRMDPEATAFATKNFWANWRANTTTALSAVVGTSANNICTIAMANLQVASAPDYGERGNKLVDNVELVANADDLSFVFT